MAVTGKGKWPNQLGLLKGKYRGTIALIKRSTTSNSQLLLNDWFFTAGNIYFGILKRYNGASWVKAKLKAYTGSFVAKPTKRYNGTEWVEIDVTGI